MKTGLSFFKNEQKRRRFSMTPIKGSPNVG